VAYRDRELYDIAVTEQRRLERAVEQSARCELCGAAAFTDMECYKCGITFSDARPVGARPGGSDTLPPGFLGGW
jgi:hypothetical protein